MYLLFDTKEHTLTPALDAPRDTRMPVTWSPDGSSVVIPKSYLPLDVGDTAEKEAREKNTYTIELELPTRTIVKIKQDTNAYYTAAWNGASSVTLSPLVGNGPPPIRYEKDAGAWKEDAGGHKLIGAPIEPIVTLEEDLNNPPQVYVSDMNGGHKTLLLDLNPQFKGLSFGSVETVTWRATDGSEWQGSLFLPPSYVPGRRYPLVIQTHGVDPTRFYIDGPYAVAFAAQPLAGRGVVVLQMGIRKSFKGPYASSSPKKRRSRWQHILVAYIILRQEV